jgi:hypothetical protein
MVLVKHTVAIVQTKSSTPNGALTVARMYNRTIQHSTDHDAIIVQITSAIPP